MIHWFRKSFSNDICQLVQNQTEGYSQEKPAKQTSVLIISVKQGKAKAINLIRCYDLLTKLISKLTQIEKLVETTKIN